MFFASLGSVPTTTTELLSIGAVSDHEIRVREVVTMPGATSGAEAAGDAGLLAAMQIDPLCQRFAAAITSVLLAIGLVTSSAVVLGLQSVVWNEAVKIKAVMHQMQPGPSPCSGSWPVLTNTLLS